MSCSPVLAASGACDLAVNKTMVYHNIEVVEPRGNRSAVMLKTFKLSVSGHWWHIPNCSNVLAGRALQGGPGWRNSSLGFGMHKRFIIQSGSFAVKPFVRFTRKLHTPAWKRHVVKASLPATLGDIGMVTVFA